MKTQTFVLVPKIVSVTQFKIVPIFALHLFKLIFNITVPTNVAAEWRSTHPLYSDQSWFK